MIYLDNAATSWPKPPQVVEAVEEALRGEGGNAGRGGHGVAMRAARRIYAVRELIAEFFGAEDPARVVFTVNATQAINQVLFGLLQPGDHVLASSLEHNAVSRPLRVLQQQGVQVTEFIVEAGGQINWERFDTAFQTNTKLVVTVHASNVTGIVLPAGEIGARTKAHGALYLLDAAQTAGVFPINMRELQVDFLAFPGHKGLFGPQGTGGLIVGPGLSLRPLLFGGTGSLSESDYQPDFLPDALESGTLNGAGIIGLGAGINYLEAQGQDQVRRREQALCRRLIDGLLKIPGIKIYGGVEAASKAPVVAFNVGNTDSMLISYMLEQEAEVIARAGLHCAPHAHTALGTLKQGIVRFSPSHVTTEAEIDLALDAVLKVAKERL